MSKVYSIPAVYLTVVNICVRVLDLALVGLQLGLQLHRLVIMVHGYVGISSWSRVRYPLCVFVFAENS